MSGRPWANGKLAHLSACSLHTCTPLRASENSLNSPLFVCYFQGLLGPTGPPGIKVWLTVFVCMLPITTAELICIDLHTLAYIAEKPFMSASGRLLCCATKLPSAQVVTTNAFVSV